MSRTIKEKKYNYFYKITNLINGHFYYGIHSTVVQIHLSGIMEMINHVDRSTQETSFKALLVEIAYCLDVWRGRNQSLV